MNKAPKIIIGVVVVVVVLVIGLVVLAKVLITPERVRETVVPLAEEALQRDVSLGEISVSLFSGIELHDLAISERDGDAQFVTSDLVRLRYQLLPLLAMQVVVDEVRIEAPRIRVERFADGRFNFSDLLGAETSADDASPAADTPSGESALNLLVTEVRIKEGQLLFLDHLQPDRAPYRHEITGFNVAATGITLDGAVPVKLDGQLNGATLELDGKVHLRPVSAEGKLALTGLEVLQFKPYFEEALPGTLGGLKLSLESNFDGSMSALKVMGSLSATDLDLTLEALPDAPFEKAQVGVDYDLAVNLDEDRLDLRSLNVDLNGIALHLEGQVTSLTGAPAVDLELEIPGLDLRDAVQALPAGLLGPAVGDLDPAGQVKVKASLIGSVDAPLELLREATVALDKVQASAGGQRPSLDGRLLLDGSSLKSEGLTLGLGENRADLALTAANLFGTPIVVRADVTSKKFLLDPLLQGGAAAAAGGDAAAAESNATETELGPFDIPVRAEGEVRIGETLWKGMRIDDFVASYQLRDNVLTVSRMDGQVAEGAFHNTARVDLGKKGLVYTADLDLKAIQADPLVSAFAPKAAGTLFGQLDMALAIKGRGTEWQVVSKQLNGDGDLNISNGRLVSPGLVKGLAGVLNLADLEELVFDAFNSNLRIKNGRVQLNGSINSSQIRLYPKGSIGLDGSLDLGLDTRLSPELAAQLDRSSKVTQYLRDDQGWTRMPLKLAGSVTTPRFGLDAKGVQESATKALQQELGKKLGEKLFGKPQTTDDPNAPQQEQEDSATKLLKGLFGQ